MSPHNSPLTIDIWLISNVAHVRHVGAATIKASGGGEVVKLPQVVEETHQYFNDAYDTVCSNLKQAHQWQKLAFDKEEHEETFQVGD